MTIHISEIKHDLVNIAIAAASDKCIIQRHLFVAATLIKKRLNTSMANSKLNGILTSFCLLSLDF